MEENTPKEPPKKVVSLKDLNIPDETVTPDTASKFAKLTPVVRPQSFTDQEGNLIEPPLSDEDTAEIT